VTQHCGMFSVMSVMLCIHIVVRTHSCHTQALKNRFCRQLNPDWRTSDALNISGMSAPLARSVFSIVRSFVRSSAGIGNVEARTRT
jgi:hypothetical protein